MRRWLRSARAAQLERLCRRGIECAAALDREVLGHLRPAGSPAGDALAALAAREGPPATGGRCGGDWPPGRAGFPWLRMAEQSWTGWIVLDVDASLVESHSDKEGATGTYKKHVFWLHPIIVSCANSGEVLAVLLRPGTPAPTPPPTTSQCCPRRSRNSQAPTAKDHPPGRWGWVEQRTPPMDQNRGRRSGVTWHYSVGFDVTEPVRDTIVAVPTRTWAPALTPDGELPRGAHVTEITGLLDLPQGWPDGMRLMARPEPLHPRHRIQASPVLSPTRR